MIDINENKQESISEMMIQGNKITDEDLNNLCYSFLELLEASLCIQYQIEKTAQQTKEMHLQILAEGFENIIRKNHERYLEIKKQNNWSNEMGEELI